MFKHFTSLTLFTLAISTLSFGQVWEDKASLPAGASDRHHPITFQIAGTGYLLTGGRPFSGVLTDFYSYDPIVDSWTTLPEFPGPSRGFGYGVSSGTKGYVGFGLYETDAGTDFTVLNDWWEFDPVSGTWTELASCPCIQRFHPAMVHVNDKIYVGLGANEFGDLGDWWEYDIPTDTWTEKTPFPSTERHHPFYFGLGEYVYVGFGHHTSSIFNDFYRYDPATDTWLTLNDFPAQGRVAGTQFTNLGRGYILSGQGETHNNLPTGEFWEYKPESDSWEELDAHPGGGRWAPGSFVIDNTVYLTCGRTNTGDESDLMAYSFETFTEVEEEPLSDLTVSPNPSENGIFNFSGDISLISNIQVFDASGRVLIETNLIDNQLDLSALNSGVYLTKMTTTNGLLTKKLIIK